MYKSPIVASYGGGVNSTAMLIGMVERSLPVDLILFADTGGERPETYAYAETFSAWLVGRGQPPIITVRVKSETLEENCKRRGVLPAIVYGFKTCSQRFKQDPQVTYLNNWLPAREAWKDGVRVMKLIGYDAGESHRIKDYRDGRYFNRYPLVQWGWGREECEEAIERAGLPTPGKSACFFCPSMTKPEVRRLAKSHPDLFARSVAMERGAADTNEKVKGLGRHWSWELVVLQTDVFDACNVGAGELPCGCYDG